MFGDRDFSVEDFLANRSTFDMMKDWEDLEYRENLADDYCAAASLTDSTQKAFRQRLRNASASLIFDIQADLNVVHKNKFPLTLKLAQLVAKHFNTANVSSELFLRALLSLPDKETRKLLAKARKLERELKKQGKSIALGQPPRPDKLGGTKRRLSPGTCESDTRHEKRDTFKWQQGDSPSRNVKNGIMVGDASPTSSIDVLASGESDREDESSVSQEQESSESAEQESAESEEQESSEGQKQDLSFSGRRIDPDARREDLLPLSKQEASSSEESDSDSTDTDGPLPDNLAKYQEQVIFINGEQEQRNVQGAVWHIVRSKQHLHVGNVSFAQDEESGAASIRAKTSNDAADPSSPASQGDIGNVQSDVGVVVFEHKTQNDSMRSRNQDTSVRGSLQQPDDHKVASVALRPQDETNDAADKLQILIAKSKARRKKRKRRVRAKVDKDVTHPVQSRRVEKKSLTTSAANRKTSVMNSASVSNGQGNLQKPRSTSQPLATSSLPAVFPIDLDAGHGTKQQTQPLTTPMTTFRLNKKTARQLAKRQKHHELKDSSRVMKGVPTRNAQDNQSSIPRRKSETEKVRSRRISKAGDDLASLSETVSPHKKQVQLSTPSFARIDSKPADLPTPNNDHAIITTFEAGIDQNTLELLELHQKPNTTFFQDSEASIPTNHFLFSSASSSSPVLYPVFSPALLGTISRSDSTVSSQGLLDHGLTDTSLATQDKVLGEDDFYNIDRFVKSFLAEDSLDKIELELRKPWKALLPAPKQAVINTVHSHLSRTSPYFATPPRKQRSTPQSTPKSCLPFPSLRARNFGLIQEQISDDPFQLVLAVTLLNCTKATVALPVFFSLVEKYPTPTVLAAAPLDEIVAMTQHLGFQNVRAKTLHGIAQTWLDAPPMKGRRYRTMHYPNPGDGKTIKPGEVLDDDDLRSGAFEIAHIHGVGPYAFDSWRIFCRDRLRGLADNWDGEGADEDFEPEWMRVLPKDKELRVFLRWKWLKKGVLWNCMTGEAGDASEDLIAAAEKDDFLWEVWEETQSTKAEPSCELVNC